MPRSRADVFFYGLFMDADLLRELGADPTELENCSLTGYTLNIGERAWLKPESNGKVFGVVASLAFADISSLYSAPSLKDYVASAVLLDAAGRSVPALCYNLPSSGGPTNEHYAEKLRAAGRKVGLPEEYVTSIGAKS